MRRRPRSVWSATTAALTLSLLVGDVVAGTGRVLAQRRDPLDATLAQAFRLDVSELRVTYDFWPSRSRVGAEAELRFRMRPGQHRPLFHFNPLRGAPAARERAMLDSLELDGEQLDPSDRGDLRPVRTFPSAEIAFEIQRDVGGAADHTLRARWSVRVRAHRGRFFATFDDTEGPNTQTETQWPTISSPEEYVRHRIRLRVHADRPYTVLGSGAVRRRRGSDVQTWELDTERSIASSIMFFAAVPSVDFDTDRFNVGNVAVTLASDRSMEITRRARRIARRTIGRLIEDFGRFPMPRMQILLTGWGSGMEYYGATRTGIGALKHELVHMYFGASVLNRAWRDTWFDESAVQWWLNRDRLPTLPPGFTSNLARGRSEVAPGFDEAAYGKGAVILGAIAESLGGDRQMIEFLADLHRRRAYRPFTTDDLIDDVVAAQDRIDRATLERWLYTRPNENEAA